MSDGIKSGEVVPLPLRLFDIEDIEEAMRYLFKGDSCGPVMHEAVPDSCIWSVLSGSHEKGTPGGCIS